jgi:hypothetical protein
MFKKQLVKVSPVFTIDTSLLLIMSECGKWLSQPFLLPYW